MKEETWRRGKKANTRKIHSFSSFFSLSIIIFITDWQCARHWAGQAGNSSKQSLWNPAFVSPWKWKRKSLSPIWLFATPWNVVHGILQASLLEWVDFPFSKGSSQPRGRTQISCTAGGFFTSQATRITGVTVSCSNRTAINTEGEGSRCWDSAYRHCAKGEAHSVWKLASSVTLFNMVFPFPLFSTFLLLTLSYQLTTLAPMAQRSTNLMGPLASTPRNLTETSCFMWTWGRRRQSGGCLCLASLQVLTHRVHWET